MINKVHKEQNIKVNDEEAKILMDAGYAFIHLSTRFSKATYRCVYKRDEQYRIHMPRGEPTEYEDAIRHIDEALSSKNFINDIILTNNKFFDTANNYPQYERVNIYYPSGVKVRRSTEILQDFK